MKNRLNIIDRIEKIEKKVGKLSCAPKILLSTDGSVTAILDVLYGRIEVKILEQKFIKADNKIAKMLDIKKNDDVIYRVALMHKNNLPLIQAASYIPLSFINGKFKKEITASKDAVGRIIKKQNLETRREILSINAEQKNGFSFSRTYKIINDGKVLIWIKEFLSPIIR